MVALPKMNSKVSRAAILVCIIILLANLRFTSTSVRGLWGASSPDGSITKLPPSKDLPQSQPQPQPQPPKAQPPSTNPDHDDDQKKQEKKPEKQPAKEPEKEPEKKPEQKPAPDPSHSSTTPSGIPNAPHTIPGIPGKVWQSAKDTKFTDEQKTIIDSWIEKNPNFRYELLTDGQAENYVITHYNATRPDIVNMYIGLPIPILRADLLRYLILLSSGGIWSDIDVTCEIDVGHWLPAEMYTNPPDISLIAGLEFDVASTEERPVYSQLTNWVFAARAGSPHLQYVVDNIVKGLWKIAEDNKVGPSGITLDMISDVVDVTGPKIMTLGIAKSLSNTLGHVVDDRHIAGIKKPTLVGDVMVMPGSSFAALQNGFPKDQTEPLVTHHYAGSWKGPADEARERRKKLQEEEQKKKEEDQKKNDEEQKKKDAKEKGEQERKEKEEQQRKEKEEKAKGKSN
jgi:mannan polymerase II complex HOC1 subunit